MGYAGAMPDHDTDIESQVQKVDWTAIEDYRTGLREPSRPPSKGGNTAALHGHSIKIGDAWFSFLAPGAQKWRSEEHTSELQSLMRSSYAVFCLKKTTISSDHNHHQ